MRGVRTLIFVFLIIIIAAVVGYVAYNTYVAPSAEVVTPAFTEVYVAGQPIAQGGTITAEALGTIKIVQGENLEVMFTIEEQPQLVGKIAKLPLEQGVVLTEAMIGDAAPPIEGPQWAALIPTGMTAISIPANRLSLSGYAVNNGAHVNLNACFLFVDVDPTFQTALPNLTAALTGTGFQAETNIPVLSLGVGAAGSPQGRLELDPSLQQPYYLLPSETQRPRMVCQMLLQDIVVMKVGDFSRDAGATIDTPSVPPTDAQGNPQQAGPPDIVTLMVLPQDAITLSYLINTDAELSLALRNPSDLSHQATEASTLQFLLSQYNIPVPAKLPYSLEPYTIGFCNLSLGSSDVCEQPAPAQ